MKSSKANPDFLRDRVLTFGTDLRVPAVHDKGLKSILELPEPAEVQLKRNRDLEERTGALIAAFQRNRESIDENKDDFLAAFWSGYALEGHDRRSQAEDLPTLRQTARSPGRGPSLMQLTSHNRRHQRSS